MTYHAAALQPSHFSAAACHFASGGGCRLGRLRSCGSADWSTASTGSILTPARALRRYALVIHATHGGDAVQEARPSTRRCAPCPSPTSRLCSLRFDGPSTGLSSLAPQMVREAELVSDSRPRIELTLREPAVVANALRNNRRRREEERRLPASRPRSPRREPREEEKEAAPGGEEEEKKEEEAFDPPGEGGEERCESDRCAVARPAASRDQGVPGMACCWRRSAATRAVDGSVPEGARGGG